MVEGGFGPGARVLMADLRWKPIEQVEVGDKVLAVSPLGRDLVFCTSTVRDVVSHRDFVASVNGRFLVSVEQDVLVDYTWKPFLQTQTAKCLFINCINWSSPSWCKGYLAGMADGDGCWYDDLHRFFLPQKEEAVLHKFKECADKIAWYLRLGRTTQGLKLLRGTNADSNMEAYCLIYQDDGSPEYAAGYLAGIFDAEGTSSTHPTAIRIGIQLNPKRSNKNPREIIARVKQYAEQLGYHFRIWVGDNGWTVLRITNPVRVVVETQPASEKRLKFIRNTLRTVQSKVPIQTTVVNRTEVIALESEVGNAVVEGFVINCVLQNFNKEKKEIDYCQLVQDN